ncbi:MAG: hypothetical protein AB1778_07005 [Candidatus Bipolaricaulota bacterium]
MNDLGKIAVISAIMGALLVVGLLLAPADRSAEEEVVVVAPEQPAVAEVTVVRDVSLEMLSPIYSEKAVYEDGTLRVSFDASFDGASIESRLPFWLHNTSCETIAVLWDRCSLQLPGGNTVPVLSEQGLEYGMGPVLSIAPGGDLFDALIPITELLWTEEGYETSLSVLDQGIFTLVLAIERGVSTAVCTTPSAVGECGPIMAPPTLQVVRAPECGTGREIAYYAFRFVIR